MKRLALVASAVTGLISFSAFAGLSLDPIPQRVNGDKPTSPIKISMETLAVDDTVEFDPTAPGAIETLQAFDQAYQAAGIDTQSANMLSTTVNVDGCVRANCPVWVDVAMFERPQHAYVYVNGALKYTWLASSAGPGYATKRWDAHPNGPIYPGGYMSKKFPGASWHGLGDMPYAMFYSGGFAIHGTPSIGRLGTPASHGCVRIDPNNALVLNQMVRQVGTGNVWFTVQGPRVAPAAALLSSN